MIFNELDKRIVTSVILLPLTIFLITWSPISHLALLIVVLIISLFEWIKMNSKLSMTIVIIGVLFLCITIFFAYIIRGNSADEVKLYIYLILISVSSDIGGYTFGKIFKGPKLTLISPKKTFSGVFGSFFFSLIPIIIYNFLDYDSIYSQISAKNIFIVFLLSLINQIGDISISYFKRKNNLKDTGNILPGHGGLLDRIDGILFVIFSFGLIKFLN